MADELFKGDSSNDPFNEASSNYPFNDASNYPFNDASKYPFTGFFQEPSEKSNPFSDRKSGRWKTQRPDEVRVTVADDATVPKEPRNARRTSETHSIVDSPSEPETLSLNRQLALIAEDKTRCRFSEVSRSRLGEIVSRRRGEGGQTGDAAADVAGRGGGSRVRPGNAGARRLGRVGGRGQGESPGHFRYPST